MKNVIAVIDDGINEKLYNTGNLLHNTEITPGLEMLERVDYDPYLSSHGTTCAAIIKKYTPQAVLSSVKILNDEARGVREQLTSALRWCVDNGIRLVNLSLGTIDYRDFDEIKKTVNYAYSKGLIIVAACNNKDLFTYPASHSNVIGVKCDKFSRIKKGEYIYNHYAPDGVEITACGRHSLTKNTGKKLVIPPSNSFAAPLITALVNDMLIQSPGINFWEIKEKLKGGGINTASEDYCPFLYKNLDWVEKAVVFNLSRSGNQTYNMKYSFETVDFINVKCDCIQEGLERVKESVCQNIVNIFDVETVVVIINDVGLAYSGETVGNFFEAICRYGKNIVYINNYWLKDEVDSKRSINSVKIWHPIVSMYFNDPQKGQADIDVPVIAVYDFTGRWLTPVAGSLRERFKENGYNTIVCDDTCSGALAGFEYTPFKVTTGGIDVSWLKCLYKVYDPDVIILGINAADYDEEYLKKLERNLEIDVRIKLVETSGNIIGEVNVGENKKLTLSFPDRGLENNPDRRHSDFKLIENDWVQELYKQIIDLFEHNEKD